MKRASRIKKTPNRRRSASVIRKPKKRTYRKRGGAGILKKNETGVEKKNDEPTKKNLHAHFKEESQKPIFWDSNDSDLEEKPSGLKRITDFFREHLRI